MKQKNSIFYYCRYFFHCCFDTAYVTVICFFDNAASIHIPLFYLHLFIHLRVIISEITLTIEGSIAAAKFDNFQNLITIAIMTRIEVEDSL